MKPTNNIADDHGNGHLRADVRLSLWQRLWAAAGLIGGLRKPDFQAAATYRQMRWGNQPWPVRWLRFVIWGFRQTFIDVPRGVACLKIEARVSRTPMWLLDENPIANHPWSQDENAKLPERVDTVVIGAGFTGSACAYHWAKRAPADRRLVVLEMDDPASGSSGRNEGLVVVGRYFKQVLDTVLPHLDATRTEISPADRRQLAWQFADRYCQAAYYNADLIEATIQAEGFECDYVRAGWVQAKEPEDAEKLAASVQMAEETEYTDWTRISPDEVHRKSGMCVTTNAGFSRAAASWHPAKWVWCLLGKAIKSPNVELFTRTRVNGVEGNDDGYLIRTNRGAIRARHLVFATESYTPKLLAQFHDAIMPMQEQAASGDGGPDSMLPHIGISGNWWFGGRYGQRVLFGSGGSRLPDKEAGRNWPSRYLTKFVAAQIAQAYGPFQLQMKNEWSGTVGYTPDEYPVVGSFDGNGQYIIGGMCGSGSGVSFNGARCVCNRILGITDEPDQYPEAYFSPTRLLSPRTHVWPEIEVSGQK
jgi:glycine/D-amino acid oxidase-like deaminating enzyme